MGRSNIAAQGGININGIIEEYKVASGGNVNAGDFVSFVNQEERTINGNILVPSPDVSLSTEQYSAYCSAVQINENQIFIAYKQSINYYLYGMVCTIDENNITIDTNIQLQTTTR